jgi:predicted amidohydrolase
MRFKIAVVQFEIKQFSPEDNLRRIEEFVIKASRAKASVVVFPEDCVNGPILKKEKYVDYTGKTKNIFQELAKKYVIDIVTGSVIEGSKSGWFNTTYYINHKGKILAKYQKINLWIYERSYIKSGDKICVFKTRYGKAGLILCWDLFAPEIFRKMIQAGVEIIYCPSYWLRRDARNGYKYNKDAVAKGIDSVCNARAFENGIIMVYANAAGQFKRGGYIDELVGHSQISVPFIGEVKKLNHNKEEIFIQEIDNSILKDAEKAYSIRKDLKTRRYFGKLYK